MKTLHLQVDHLYERAKLLDNKKYSELSAVFKMQRKKGKKKGIVALTLWINLASVILMKVEKREAGNIDRWLKQKETYIGEGDS